jgi:hypothetical protein
MIRLSLKIRIRKKMRKRIRPTVRIRMGGEDNAEDEDKE